MATTKDRIIESLKQEIEGFTTDPAVEHVGTVTEVGDGIARMTGLSAAKAQEMVEFPNGEFGVILNPQALIEALKTK